jgi:hypothetical protein
MRYSVGMGLKTSVYLSDDLAAQWRASKLPLAEVIRRGLTRSDEEPVTKASLRHILREELTHIPAPDCRASSGYGSGTYESEAYLQDP